MGDEYRARLYIISFSVRGDKSAIACGLLMILPGEQSAIAVQYLLRGTEYES